MDVSDFDPGASGCTDNRGNAIALSVGLQFHPNIAVEFGYVNLGKFGASAVGTELGVPLSESADYKAKGFQATLVGIIPVSKQVDILGRIGVFRWDWNLTSTGIEGGVPFSRDETTHGTDVTYGIGAQYNVSKNISARLEWQRFQNVGDQPMNGQTNIDMFSLGLVYRFK